jgi:DNA-directed RNA polymerase specialized sigma24 family protein
MPDSIVPGEREFHTTRWSLVLAAQRRPDTPEARDALASLCRDYWYPLYAFVRLRGYSAHDAQDLTQGFFADLLGRHGAPADPSKGKFRSYLLGALKHFLANDWHRQQAGKRGGGHKLISWDALEAESRYALEIPESTDAELLYDRRWALEILSRATGRLRAEYAAKNDEATFEALKGCLSGEEIARAELAEKMGMTEGALKVAIHRLRHRFRERLRAEIAQTVGSVAELDEEMRHLVRMLRSG